MIVGVPRETYPGERRVALVPSVIPNLAKAGLEVVVEAGAGVEAGYPDADYAAKGAKVLTDRAKVFEVADIVVQVLCHGSNDATGKADLPLLHRDQVLIGFLRPLGAIETIDEVAATGATSFSVELMPRTTRAQSMDALSSMGTICGYKAVLLAADALPRLFPMMTTAAGTITPARVFIIGAGVAGLQAIATARRLGAIVTATDVRPATKEQVESLGAKFLAVEDEEFKNAQTAGGYAKEMSKEYQAKQAALVAEHVKKQDIVITTALIPGRPAPKLISKEMVASMRPGSVIVDLAVERGGNVEGAKAGEIVQVGPAKIVGYLNVAGRLAASASALYAKNLLTFLDTMIDKKDKKLAVNWDDEIVKGTLLTRDGAVVHPNFKPKTAA